MEDHHHVLPHIHWLLRRQQSAASSKGKSEWPKIELLHFDAHPDLAVPNVDTSTLMKPRQLYDELDDSKGGIAEWILPLVYMRHVERIVWVKRKAICTQFSCGKFDVKVGESEGRLAVDSGGMDYWKDDGVERGRLNDGRRLRLEVFDGDEGEDEDDEDEVEIDVDGSSPSPFKGSWVLDICLDVREKKKKMTPAYLDATSSCSFIHFLRTHSAQYCTHHFVFAALAEYSTSVLKTPGSSRSGRRPMQ